MSSINIQISSCVDMHCALAGKLQSLASTFPVLFRGGPRQSGKTTLARAVFPRHDYVSLEDPDERAFALSDPRGFLARFVGGAILDEVQRVPDLFSYLQGIVDRDRAPGRIVLTGSQQCLLMQNLSQSLAGRVALVTLLPFSLADLLEVQPLDIRRVGKDPTMRRQAPPFRLERVLRQGFYPALHNRSVDAADWMPSSSRTYVERDVRELLSVGDLDTFGRFLRLAAGRSGHLLNLSRLVPMPAYRTRRPAGGCRSWWRAASCICSRLIMRTTPSGS